MTHCLCFCVQILIIGYSLNYLPTRTYLISREPMAANVDRLLLPRT